MNDSNPIDLLFGGMEKLGPGSDADTRHVLGLLPEQQRRVVVDAGCGTGRQTLVLAKDLGIPIDAVDSYEPFLNDLSRRAARQGVARLIRPHCMNMKDISVVFPHIDLLWSEGAAYNIGFAAALSAWAPAINSGGCAVISEMSWMHDRIPGAVREFFDAEYAGMRTVPQNLEAARLAGYEVLATHTLSRETWMKGYYDVLEPRARLLLHHPEAAVREFAAGMIREVEIFGLSENSYAYVFYVLGRP
jgi:trans-aconitate methyltransferase